jgi:hypothetical protein
MAELGWTVSEVTQEHLQNLMSQWYMTAVELATCCVSEDPTSPTLVAGYVMVCTAFYEQGFGVSSHQFLHSLLLFYGLELHQLTPSGILCEAYMGIEPHFDMWNYIFRVQLQQGSDAEVAVLGGVDNFP